MKLVFDWFILLAKIAKFFLQHLDFVNNIIIVLNISMKCFRYLNFSFKFFFYFVLYSLLFTSSPSSMIDHLNPISISKRAFREIKFSISLIISR